MQQSPPKPVCPKCKKGVLEMRVKRSLMMKLIRPNAKRYMCYNCKRKSYIEAYQEG